MCHPQTPILPKTPPSMMRLISCAFLPPAALAERQDVIIVASVSCIYGLGSPVDYKNMVISLRPGQEQDRDEVMQPSD